MPNTLAMFPGQGSQSVGMGKVLLDQFKQAALVFEEAEDAAKLAIRKLCLEGPEEELKLTANTQPCILTASVAMWRVLEEEAGFKPHAFAGHSLGEYSAAVAAGRLDFARAVWLVHERGKAMQTAVPEGKGAMAAVMNMEAPTLEALCADLSNDDAAVEVVNYNSPQQLVVAGHKISVDKLCHKLEEQGVRFVPLPVSAPFHSRLMTPARDAMAPLLEQSEFKDGGTIIANLTGDVAADYGADYLIKQIDAPVRWTQALATAEAQGCDSFVEVGPGRVLFGLARRTLPKGTKLMHTDDPVKGISDLQAL